MQIPYLPSLFSYIIMRMFLLLFSFIFFAIPSAFSSFPRPTPHLTNVSDQEALLGFRSAITYDTSQFLSDWKPNVSFCHWTGIICSRRRQRVVSLNVSSMGLQGEDMTSYLIDFGIATICFANSEDSALTSTHALKGSAGYIPPEYGLGGCVTTKGDVYSYGIVLLEMLTGKKPTNNMFVEGMSLPKWVDSAFPNQVGDVVDKSLLRSTNMVNEQDKDLNCLRQLISVGLLCTKESPEGRPTMLDVVGTLQNMRESFLGVTGIPKFQSDITHLLASSSTTRNNVGEVQSSSTF